MIHVERPAESAAATTKRAAPDLQRVPAQQSADLRHVQTARTAVLLVRSRAADWSSSGAERN